MPWTAYAWRRARGAVRGGGLRARRGPSEALGPPEKPPPPPERRLSELLGRPEAQKAAGLPSLPRRPAHPAFPPGSTPTWGMPWTARSELGHPPSRLGARSGRVL
eukprot:1173740-Pyramimonas_sp.AAC.1